MLKLPMCYAALTALPVIAISVQAAPHQHICVCADSSLMAENSHKLAMINGVRIGCMTACPYPLHDTFQPKKDKPPLKDT